MLAIFILHWHHFAVSYLRRVKVSPLLYVTICSSLFLKYVFIISTVFCKFHYHLSVCFCLLKTSLKPCLLVTCVPFTYMPIKVCSNHQSHSPWGHPEVPLLQNSLFLLTANLWHDWKLWTSPLQFPPSKLWCWHSSPPQHNLHILPSSYKFLPHHHISQLSAFTGHSPNIHTVNAAYYLDCTTSIPIKLGRHVKHK